MRSVRHEKPTRETLFNLATTIGECRRRGLSEECLGVAQYGTVKGEVSSGQLLEGVLHSCASPARDLDVGCVLSAIVSQYDTKPVIPSRPMMPTSMLALSEPFATTEAKPDSMK